MTLGFGVRQEPAKNRNLPKVGVGIVQRPYIYIYTHIYCMYYCPASTLRRTAGGLSKPSSRKPCPAELVLRDGSLSLSLSLFLSISLYRYIYIYICIERYRYNIYIYIYMYTYTYIHMYVYLFVCM